MRDEERENVLISLQAGLAQLKTGFITNPQIQILIIRPIKYVINKLTDGAIVESGKLALEKIIELIGN